MCYNLNYRGDLDRKANSAQHNNVNNDPIINQAGLYVITLLLLFHEDRYLRFLAVHSKKNVLWYLETVQHQSLGKGKLAEVLNDETIFRRSHLFIDCRERALSAAFFKASLLSFQVEANHFRTSCTYPPPPVVVEDVQIIRPQNFVQPRKKIPATLLWAIVSNQIGIQSLSLIFYSCWIDCDDSSPAQQHPT